MLFNCSGHTNECFILVSLVTLLAEAAVNTCDQHIVLVFRVPCLRLNPRVCFPG